MNILNRKQHQRGVGLIEVLIALAVIAVGVIAVLGLQGTLMSGSATTKARNEAVALAREKTEALRSAVELAQFDTELVTPDSTEDIDGVNAQFTRSWSIMGVDVDGDGDATNDSLKELVMQVTWSDAQGVKNDVELNTLIAYASPLNSALSAGDTGGLSPLGTQTGYEGKHDDTPMDEVDADLANLAVDEDADFGITDVLRYSNGHVQVRKRKKIEDEVCPVVNPVTGFEDCVVCTDADTVTIGGVKYCVVFTAFGGTLLRFGGAVYVKGYLSSYKEDVFDEALLVKATSPAYCAHHRTDCGEVDGMDCIEYLCYASGDCTKGGVGCPGDPSNLPDLNGGWYGKIGHFFPLETSAVYPAICMSKHEKINELSGEVLVDEYLNPLLEDNKIIARSYYSLRTVENPDTDGNQDWREGINQSYSCHNTLIVDSPSGECGTGYDDLYTAGIIWNSIKDHKVIRNLSSDNIVLGTDRSYCNIVSIYGDIYLPEDGADPLLDVPGNMKIEKIGKTIFHTVKTVKEGGSVDGECVTKGSAALGFTYVCNFVDDAWRGTIKAIGTRPYTITTNPGGEGEITEIWDVTCVDTLDYTDLPATGRNSGQDLFLECSIDIP